MTLSMLALKHQKEAFASPEKLSASTWQVLRLCSPHKNKLTQLFWFFLLLCFPATNTAAVVVNAVSTMPQLSPDSLSIRGC